MGKITEIKHGNPGPGAIAYAKQFIEGMTREQAAPIMTALLNGELNDCNDRRVKQCDCCCYYWRDDSLRNTKRTCSDECKTAIKTLQRRQQRADDALLNPKSRKHTLMDDYIHWLEYPFWINEYSMIKIGWKYEKPSGLAVMDYVETKRSIYGEGNSKKVTRNVEF
ncbi:hypothetical protein [Neobacillus drentensis]|uniref:hypothetical protein n=1 Tax=Neobacillus drentensis TaxID=220684 RepID=UPI003000496D